jgi:uncharacterized protein (TIGR04255 family)
MHIENERSFKSNMTEMPHFEHAPLDEVVCGVRFGGIQWIDIHFGLFYAELNRRFGQTRRRPLIHPSLFDPTVSAEPQLTLVTEPDLPLLWYESDDSPFLLQVQADAFLVNWRRQSGKFVYPHFRTRHEGGEGIWDRFVAEWGRFRAFCGEQQIGTPETLACHLAYINHLVQGETWNDPVDLVHWFQFLAGLKSFESLASLNFSVRYQVEGLSLRINVRPAVRISDQKKLFIIEYVISGKLPAETTLETWFDKAHEVIVQRIVAQTTEEAHQQWGLSRG